MTWFASSAGDAPAVGQRTDPSDGDAGFSLVELLVALALLGTIASLTASFLTNLKPLRRMQSEMTVQSEAAAIGDYLRTALTGAMRLPLLFEPEKQHIFLLGSPSEIRFVATVRQGAMFHGLRETSLFLRQTDGRQDLVQQFFARRFDISDGRPLEEVVLLSDVETLAFTYLRHDPERHEPIWTDSWEGQNTLPAAVQIDAAIVRDGRRYPLSARAILALSDIPEQPVLSPTN